MGTIRCAKCEYDLRGTAADAACPECGHPVRESLAAGPLPASATYRIVRTGFVTAALATGCLQIWFELRYGRSSPSTPTHWTAIYYSFQPLIIRMAIAVLGAEIAFVAISPRARRSVLVWIGLALLIGAAWVDWQSRDSWLFGLWLDLSDSIVGR